MNVISVQPVCFFPNLHLAHAERVMSTAVDSKRDDVLISKLNVGLQGVPFFLQRENAIYERFSFGCDRTPIRSKTDVEDSILISASSRYLSPNESHYKFMCEGVGRWSSLGLTNGVGRSSRGFREGERAMMQFMTGMKWRQG